MKKRNKKGTILRIGELAEETGLRASTIKYYVEQKLLPFEQEDKRLGRHFDKTTALQRLKEIQALKDKRKTIEEIIDHFKRK